MARKFLIMIKYLQKMRLKLLQEGQFKKQQKKLLILLVLELLIKSQRYLQNENKQMRKKYI